MRALLKRREAGGGRGQRAATFYPRPIPNRGERRREGEMLNGAGFSPRGGAVHSPHRVVRERLHLRVHVIEVLHLLHRRVPVHVPMVVSAPGHRVDRVCVCTFGGLDDCQVRCSGFSGVRGGVWGRSRDVEDVNVPYRASYGRPGAGCRTLVIPPSLTTSGREEEGSGAKYSVLNMGSDN